METKLNQKMSIVQKLEQTSPAQIATMPEVADRFQHIYTVMNGGDKARAAIKYEAEKFHFAKLIQDNPALQQCSKLSLYGCFLDMAVNGLSFDPSLKHAYVVSFNTNVGGKNNPKWEKRAGLMISGYGELFMRVRQRQIKYADNPILVYEGDVFEHGTRDGKVFLNHVAKFPRKTDNIIACYLRIERNDGSTDYKVLSIEEVMKLKKFSKDPNSKAWGDGLPGMVQAKTLKHAFRSYPKMRLGDFSTLQSEVVDDEHEDVPLIDYGLNGDMHPKAAIKPPVIPQEGNDTIDDEAFAESDTPPATSQTFNDDDF